MRPSVVAMAGWPGGYSNGARGGLAGAREFNEPRRLFR